MIPSMVSKYLKDTHKIHVKFNMEQINLQIVPIFVRFSWLTLYWFQQLKYDMGSVHQTRDS